MAMNRREAIILGLGSAGAVALAQPALAQEENPMPAELRKALEEDRNAPILGNPKGNITLTEFFDYNCPFCRVVVGDMHRLILADKDLRVNFREWPVFGEGSEFTSRASLASMKQGKYWQFHAGMMAIRGKANETSAMKVANDVGLDITKLRTDMEGAEVQDHISRSMELADHMGLMGTPTFIAGNEALFGKQSQADLAALVARGRKALL